jgi:hypothetical protein
MAQGRDDGSIAPRRSLGGPILPPPPPAMAEDARKAAQEQARQEQLKQEKAAQERAAEERAQAEERARAEKVAQKAAAKQAAADAAAAEKAARAQSKASAKASARATGKTSGGGAVASPATGSTGSSAVGSAKAARRTRRAQLRLVQVDAWSVMKTAFLLSIALGIVLVVAVSIIWAVLGAAGVWDSINSIVQQAVGGETGKPFDITEYAGTSRVLGFTMIVAVIDVVLITAIATLGAFLYNLSAALLGGIEVTLAEDS